MEKKYIPNAPLPEATKLMGYDIVKVIARGSFSFVYLAQNKQEQLVAIKEYIPQEIFLREANKLDLNISFEHRKQFRKSLKSFFSEFRTLSGIKHPRIVSLVDFFRAHNTFYIVMNYAPGLSLKDFIRHRLDNRMFYDKDSLLYAYLRYRHYKKQLIGSRQIIGERLIKKIFLQLIDGITALHDKEILHLDLKPANIYLHRDGTSLLLDLGAARRPSEKKEISWVFTRRFAAPELVQKQRASIGPWTDVYGVGATIFACMCGHPPQAAEQRVVQDKLPQSFKALRKIYSKDLLELVESCMRLEPWQRPQTMAELQGQLFACLPRPSTPLNRKFTRRLSKWLRRKIKPGPKVESYS